ncbi:GNAT family N-acetyltransferase [Shewanella avicenniae]|uniref:GNAT family N-acetyltransferase n=1 Tax=Shewanella avicenniae TaxID=2814294 RepID=A0ABX7QPL7_9GAMM|nr:GNAT family N-acetyltransferase [Shewanella avicenniae]QSX33214.1 GNAT family N-acetyltransferase [Shewanella avicenniae]
MQLIAPDSAFQAAFYRFYQDFVQWDPSNAGYYAAGVEDFASYLQQLHAEARGEQLMPEQVPCNHYWLVDNGEILGAIRLRHHIETPYLNWEGGHIGYDVAPSQRSKGYATMMLHQVLQQARARGLTRVLLVAEEQNKASRKVIEANGGEVDKVIVGMDDPEPLVRYWINLA